MEEGGSKLPAAFGMDEDKKRRRKIENDYKEKEEKGNSKETCPL